MENTFGGIFIRGLSTRLSCQEINFLASRFESSMSLQAMRLKRNYRDKLIFDPRSMEILGRRIEHVEPGEEMTPTSRKNPVFLILFLLGSGDVLIVAPKDIPRDNPKHPNTFQVQATSQVQASDSACCQALSNIETQLKIENYRLTLRRSVIFRFQGEKVRSEGFLTFFKQWITAHSENQQWITAHSENQPCDKSGTCRAMKNLGLTLKGRQTLTREKENISAGPTFLLSRTIIVMDVDFSFGDNGSHVSVGKQKDILEEDEDDIDNDEEFDSADEENDSSAIQNSDSREAHDRVSEHHKSEVQSLTNRLLEIGLSESVDKKTSSKTRFNKFHQTDPYPTRFGLGPWSVWSLKSLTERGQAIIGII